MEVINLKKGKKFRGHNFIENFVRIFSVPLLNILPSFIIKRIMEITSIDSKTVVKYGGSSLAVEVMYSAQKRSFFSKGVLTGIADYFWHNYISQSKAIRNRLDIVKENIEEELVKIIERKQKSVTLVTIGGGIARSITESVNRLFKNKPDFNIKIINIDNNKDALKLSKEFSKELNLSKNFEWINSDAQNLKFLIPENSIDIVEIVGLLDYMEENNAINILQQIYKVLKKNGCLIAANVYPNKESVFIHKTGWPKMYYRKPEIFLKLLELANFSSQKIKIFKEPLNCHIVAIAKK